MNQKIQKLLEDKAKNDSRIAEYTECLEKLKAKAKKIDEKIIKANDEEILRMVKSENISYEELAVMIRRFNSGNDEIE